MKKSSIILIIFMMNFMMLRSQVNDGWIEIGNASYNSELFSVSFSCSDSGVAVGNGGAFLNTLNRGSLWVAQNAGFSNDLKKIVFLNSMTGYLMGSDENSSKVYRTNDGGNSWTEIFSTGATLNKMVFNSVSEGWLTTYDQYFHTVDSGRTWSPTTLHNRYDIWDMRFITPDTGFMATNSSVYRMQRTTDGGASWSLTLSNYIHYIQFPSKNYGYALQGGSMNLFRTNDKGDNWTTINTGLGGPVKGVMFVNDSVGYCWGTNSSSGAIYRTVNYGSNWSVVYQSGPAEFNSIASSPSGKLFAVGKGGLILGSVNGLLWDTLHEGTVNGTLRRLFFTDDNHGFAAGEKGSMIKTEDAGVSWHKIPSLTSENLSGLDFINPTTGLVAGDIRTVYKTSNAGGLWNISNTGYNGSQCFDLQMTDSQTGYIGTNIGVYKTTDCGDHWTLTGNTGIAYSMACLSNDTLLTGAVNSLKYSYDGGTTWNTYTVPLTFYSLYFHNSLRGFIADAWGRIRKTINGGQSWTLQHDCNQTVYDMTFINDTIAYFAADNGYIGKTTDGGNTWFQVESGTTRNLKSIKFTPDGTGFITGEDGILLRKTAAPTFTLKFIVEDESANPVSNATLTLNGAVYPAGIDSVAGLIEGDYHYLLSKAGYRSDSGTVHLVSDSTITAVLFTFNTISFRCTNVFGDDVDSAVVTLNGIDTSMTDYYGYIEFGLDAAIPSVDYSVERTAYLPINGTLTISGDTVLPIILQADLAAPLALTVSGTEIDDYSFLSSWEDVAEADSFLLYVSDDNFITHLQGYNGLVLSGLSRQVNGLNPGIPYAYRLRSMNAFGYSGYSNVINVTTTDHVGIDSYNGDGGLNVSPNPVADFILIRWEKMSPVRLEILDMTGRVVLCPVIYGSESKTVINLQELRKGIYTVKLFSNKGLYFSKIVVQ